MYVACDRTPAAAPILLRTDTCIEKDKSHLLIISKPLYLRPASDKSISRQQLLKK